MRWWRAVLVVGVLAAVTSCSLVGHVDTALNPESPGRWGTCTTRLAYVRTNEEMSSPEAATRDHGLATLRAFPVPDGHAESWAALLAYGARFNELAEDVTVTDQKEFKEAMAKAMRSEPTQQALMALDDDEMKALVAVGTDPPCDPTGLPAGFGCADPTSCTQAWAKAAHNHDDAALDLLSQQPVTGNLTPSETLTAVTCEAGDHGATTCSAQGTPVPGSSVSSVRYKVSWAPTADGRWYGAGVVTSKFQSVGSAIG